MGLVWSARNAQPSQLGSHGPHARWFHYLDRFVATEKWLRAPST